MNIIIVGGGPSGLTIGYYLQKLGYDYLILEKGGIGETWKNQYTSLRLNMFKQVSNLHGLKMPNHFSNYPSAIEFHTYLNDYANKYKLKVLCNVELQKASYINGKWELYCGLNFFYADILILCTGISKPYLPTIDNILNYTGKILHSSNYKNHKEFIGKRILVIGAGSSAIDIVNDLARNGIAVSISIRSGVNLIPRINSVFMYNLVQKMLKFEILRKLIGGLSYVLKKKYEVYGLYPNRNILNEPGYHAVIGTEIVDFVKNGIVQTHRGVKYIENGHIVFDGGAKKEFDAIIFATGYRPNIPFIDKEININHGLEISENEKVIFVGYKYSPRISWLQEVDKVAEIIVNKIKKWV